MNDIFYPDGYITDLAVNNNSVYIYGNYYHPYGGGLFVKRYFPSNGSTVNENIDFPQQLGTVGSGTFITAAASSGNSSLILVSDHYTSFSFLLYLSGNHIKWVRTDPPGYNGVDPGYLTPGAGEFLFTGIQGGQAVGALIGSLGSYTNISASLSSVYPGYSYNSETVWNGSSFAIGTPSGIAYLDPNSLAVTDAYTGSPTQMLTSGNGIIYETYDYQQGHLDVAVLSYSTDGGATWHTTVTLTPAAPDIPHIMVTVTAGSNGNAYVTWYSQTNYSGWSEYLAEFRIRGNIVSSPIIVSRNFGEVAVWGGDTTGLSYLGHGTLEVSWGYAASVGGNFTAEIYAENIHPSFSFGWAHSADMNRGERGASYAGGTALFRDTRDPAGTLQCERGCPDADKLSVKPVSTRI